MQPLEAIGCFTLLFGAAGLIVGLIFWLAHLYERAEQHTRWKDRVTEQLYRIESSCMRLESLARKSQKPKVEAKRK